MQELNIEIASVERMLFVVGEGACASEIYCDGWTKPEFHDR